MADRFDIVVIGAGPAGSFAAKTAAEKGARVLLLEEHHLIGKPRHCPGWLVGMEFTERLVETLQNRMPIQKVHGFQFCDTASGEIVEVPDTGWGGYIVNRQLFDHEIALMALEAGARISINTRAVELIKEGDRTVGVRTNSKRLPEILSDVVVCADGIRSLSSGFGKKELLSGEEDYFSAVSIELTGAKGLNPGTIECYVGPDRALSGRSLWPRSERSCMIAVPNINEFRELQARDDNVLSRRIKDAQVVRVEGFFCRVNVGRFCERVSKKGILFVGDASGNHGIIHGMISACYGANAAVSAVREKNPDLLENYDHTLRTSGIYKTPFCWGEMRKGHEPFRDFVEPMKDIQV
ncbi:MAG: NAD(P)/FAD-dependent oxidoreductase [Pseudomonadota bacterium]